MFSTTSSANHVRALYPPPGPAPSPPSSLPKAWRVCSHPPLRHPLFKTKLPEIDFPRLIARYRNAWSTSKKSGGFAPEPLVAKIADDIGYCLEDPSLDPKAKQNRYFTVSAFFSLCLILPDLEDARRDAILDEVLPTYPSLRAFPPLRKLLEHIGYLSSEAFAFSESFLQGLGR